MSEGRAACILVAAGQGVRMGLPHAVPPTTKARIAVAGRSLLELALEPLLRHPELAPIVVVVHPGDLAWARSRAPAAVQLVQGGARRQDSVAAALPLVEGSERVLVHDVARPLIDSGVIDRLLAALECAGADGRPCAGAVPVLPVADTVRRVDARGRNLGVIDRADLRLVQTPQVFRTEVLVAAHAALAGADIEVTDDAQAVERLGESVILVEGDARAFKLTVPMDLDRLRVMLGHGRPICG